MKHFFLITIDTEGDNLWGVKDIRAKIATENARYLPRFQELCEKYGFVVTYLTNYEMALDPFFLDFASDGIKRGTIEIGAHEHSWNQPPYFPLFKSPSYRGKPYLSEYPSIIIREKLKRLTALLEDSFGCGITSHRGGRWCMDGRIAKTLLELGYIVDCTCTPWISRTGQPGWTIGSKGTDWSQWTNEVKVLSEGRNGKKLIEVPATVINRKNGITPVWFRPNGHNLDTMLGMIDYINDSGINYIEFMIHSSELMPGGNPTFKRNGQIEKLYDDMNAVFSKLRKIGYVGAGLSNYAKTIEI